jgi:Bacterial Ig domain
MIAARHSQRRNSRRRPLRSMRPMFELLEDRSLPSVTILSGTDGLDFAATGDGAPPDTIAAAGPNHIVEMVNTDIAIYTKAGAQVFHQDLSQFFGSVFAGNAISDPFVMYDEQAQRFVVGVLDLSVSFFGTISSDRLMFAVSDSSDPTADTNGDGKAFSEMHSIDLTESVPAGTVFADYPRVGWNADGYAVTFNMFTTGFFNTYDHASVVMVDKASATDANNASFTFRLSDVPGGVGHATLAPATMHGSIASTPGSPQPMYFVEEKLDSNGNPVGNAIRVVTATNLLTSPSFQFTDVPVASYSAPPSATQKGTTALMTTNDSRVLNAEWRNNQLAAAQTVGVSSDSQAHARWYVFNTSGVPVLSQQGTIGVGSGSHSYFPSIAIAPSGDLGMTFIQSSSNEYMSMYVTGRTSADPAGTMQTPVVAQAGQAPYSASFDSSPYRAGDYSGITIDPNDGTFWAANEYAKIPVDSRANWGTFITNMTLGATGPDTTPPTVTVNAPNGGENWTAGSTHNITWTATDNVGVASVDILYSTDGSTYSSIATGSANTGSYSWIVPNTPTTTAFVKVIAYDAATNSGQDVSNAAFTISPPDATAPTVTVTAPNGGENWTVATTHAITWSASDDVGVTTVDIYYSTTGAGGTFTAIAAGVSNTGSYNWAVPNTPSTNAFVKVVAHDGAGNTGQDLSDNAFTISAPVGNANDMYVWDQSWVVTVRGNWINVSDTVTIRRDSNANGIAEVTDAVVPGAVMNFTMDHYLSGVLIASTSFTNAKTNGNGQVTFTVKTQIGGDFTATVTKLTKSGLTWNVGLDQDNPSHYAGAPGGGEVPHVGDIPPGFLNPNRNGTLPTLPVVAFSRSPSPLLNSEELNLDIAVPPPGNSGASAHTVSISPDALDQAFAELLPSWRRSRNRWL